MVKFIEPIKVLIVDDHLLFCHGLKSLLETRPRYVVVGMAATGREALVLQSERKADVVLMDISMPDMGGLEAAREILRQHPKTKVIMLTMYDDEQFFLEAFRIGVSGYLMKKIDAFGLFSAIESALKGEKVVASSISGRLINGFLNGRKKGESGDIFHALTPREREILKLWAEGKKRKEIGDRLCISTGTVDAHLTNIKKKLGLASKAEMIRYAVKQKLIEI
jgi:DNA-binding NarL/FixJ family response regulator